MSTTVSGKTDCGSQGIQLIKTSGGVFKSNCITHAKVIVCMKGYATTCDPTSIICARLPETFILLTGSNSRESLLILAKYYSDAMALFLLPGKSLFSPYMSPYINLLRWRLWVLTLVLTWA